MTQEQGQPVVGVFMGVAWALHGRCMGRETIVQDADMDVKIHD